MKTLAIVALVLSIVSIFVPFVSLYVTWLALILATIAAFSEEATLLVILTSVFSFLNIFVFSPFSFAALIATPPLLVITVFLLPAPGVVCILRKLGAISSNAVKTYRAP